MISAAAAAWKTLPVAQRWMILILTLGIALANVAQPYPDLAPLQHGPTVGLILASPWLLRRWPLSSLSVGSITLFLALHTLGGRYIYSYVPYDVWSEALAGVRLSDLLGTQRNGYDRLVHFAFGALLTLPVVELAGRHGGLGHRWSMFTAFAFVGLVSSLYEIFEWLLTLVAAGETADYYNGQQGDIWDAQKDMGLAMLGSILSLGLAWMAGRMRKNGQ